MSPWDTVSFQGKRGRWWNVVSQKRPHPAGVTEGLTHPMVSRTPAGVPRNCDRAPGGIAALNHRLSSEMPPASVGIGGRRRGGRVHREGVRPQWRCSRQRQGILFSSRGTGSPPRHPLRLRLEIVKSASIKGLCLFSHVRSLVEANPRLHRLHLAPARSFGLYREE